MKVGFIIIFIGTIILATIYTGQIAIKLETKKVDEQGNCKFIQPALYRWLPILGVILASGLSIYIVLFQKDDMIWLIFFLMIIFICILISIAFSLWKVEIKKESFIYRNCIGIQKEYFYKDIECKDAYTYYLGEKVVFRMPSYIKDGRLLYRIYKKHGQDN